MANSHLALAELLGHPAVVVVDGLHVLAAGLDLRGGRRPVEDPHEQLVDQLGVVALGGHQPGQLVGRVGDGVAERRAADQGHDRPELHAAGALALAGALAGRAAEGRQEAAGQLDARVGQAPPPGCPARRPGTSRPSRSRGRRRRATPRPAAGGPWRASS